MPISALSSNAVPETRKDRPTISNRRASPAAISRNASTRPAKIPSMFCPPRPAATPPTTRGAPWLGTPRETQSLGLRLPARDACGADSLAGASPFQRWEARPFPAEPYRSQAVGQRPLGSETRRCYAGAILPPLSRLSKGAISTFRAMVCDGRPALRIRVIASGIRLPIDPSTRHAIIAPLPRVTTDPW
jgi:hypothetical protein